MIIKKNNKRHDKIKEQEQAIGCPRKRKKYSVSRKQKLDAEKKKNGKG